MAEKDLRKNQAIETETSFIEEHHDRQGFQAIEVSEVDRQISGEGSANLPSTELTCGHQRLNPTTGIIQRIGRHISHVKSAVGGTVTMFMQSGKSQCQVLCYILISRSEHDSECFHIATMLLLIAMYTNHNDYLWVLYKPIKKACQDCIIIIL